MSLLDLAPLAPARADPDDDVEGERAERWSGVDALDHAELVGGVERTYQLAASCTLDGARAPEAPAARFLSTQVRSVAKPRVRGGRTTLGAAGERLGRRLDLGGRLARSGLRQATLDERPKRGVRASWGTARGPFMAPPGWEQGGNETGRDDAETSAPRSGRDPSPEAGDRETTRDRPRPSAATFNPKVEGSNPSRPTPKAPLRWAFAVPPSAG